MARVPTSPRQTLLSTTDAVLRGSDASDTAPHVPHENSAASNDTARMSVALLTSIVTFGLIYGAAMGTFGGMRPAQVLFSAVKVPLLLLVTGAIGLPSIFVLYSLSGLRDDFSQVLRGLLATQAAHATVLAALAPFTLLWYASCADYRLAVLFNALMFAVATASTQRVLRRYCRELIARNARHRTLLWAWLALYVFIGIQMGWMLRPFIGDPTRTTTFFRPDGLSNAYEALVRFLL
ncbi:MAG TPA: hypothetical protein VF600_08860 [Abditibacteriaceae bacterium]|jgi:hypothetical protein